TGERSGAGGMACLFFGGRRGRLTWGLTGGVAGGVGGPGGEQGGGERVGQGGLFWGVGGLVRVAAGGWQLIRSAGWDRRLVPPCPAAPGGHQTRRSTQRPT